MEHDAYWSVHDCAWARCAASQAAPLEEDLRVLVLEREPRVQVVLPDQRADLAAEPVPR